MCSVARYPSWPSPAGVAPWGAFAPFTPTASAAAPALPRPAARRNLRRSSLRFVFMAGLLGELRFSIHPERLRFERHERRAERGDRAIEIGRGRGSERGKELARAGLHVGLEEAALLLEARGAAAGATQHQHAHRLEEGGEVV